MATFNGTPGNDNLVGTANADTFNPELGNDAVSGLGGDDTINYRGGSDEYDGGAAVDTVVISEDIDASVFQGAEAPTLPNPAPASWGFQGGLSAGDDFRAAGFEFFYDTGSNTDTNGILTTGVELFQFDDFLFDTTVSQIVPVALAAPVMSPAASAAQGMGFDISGFGAGQLLQARGYNAPTQEFEAAATAREITNVNGTDITENGQVVTFGGGSQIRVQNGGTTGQVEYSPGAEFLASVGTFANPINLAGTADETVVATITDGSNPVDVEFTPMVQFGANFDDNYLSHVIQGTTVANAINAQGGDDFVSAGDGDDVVTGGAGDDQLFAGGPGVSASTTNGNDLFVGNEGNDTLGGGAGDDFLVGDSLLVGATAVDSLGGAAFGGSVPNGPAGFTDGATGTAAGGTLDDGSDDISGGDGNDVIITGSAADLNGNGDIEANEIFGFAPDAAYGAAGDDSIVGAGGDDSLFAGEGDDAVAGLDGDDQLGGRGGNDFIEGDAGDDQIFGAAGNDTLDGDAGDDLIFGGAGNDDIEGWAGNDTLWAGTGDDTLEGDGGENIFAFVRDPSSTPDEITDFTDAFDLIDLSELGVSFSDISQADSAGDRLLTINLGGGDSQQIQLNGEAGTVLTEADFIL